MVKSETRRDAEILVRNPSPRLFGKKFRDSKKVNTSHAKTRLRDLSKTLPRFRGTIRHPYSCTIFETYLIYSLRFLKHVHLDNLALVKFHVKGVKVNVHTPANLAFRLTS